MALPILFFNTSPKMGGHKVASSASRKRRYSSHDAFIHACTYKFQYRVSYGDETISAL